MINSRTKNLQELVQGFFISFMIQQKQASQKTVNSYRDCFKLFFRYLSDVHGITPDRARMENFGRDYIAGFMDFLKRSRGCSANTVNQRMAVIRSFLRKYVAFEAPEYMELVKSVLAIPAVRFDRKAMCFITKDEYKAMLKACEECIALTERDKVLIAMLYNTGCRVSELVDVRITDFRHLSERNNTSVLLHGKGRKERITPLWSSTAKIIDCYVRRLDLKPSDNLIVSNAGHPMTRSGIAQRISKLADVASSIEPSLKEKNVTPHTFRHSVAMNMLQAGVDISSIAIFLGHESIETTHKYIVSDLEMKRRALQKTEEIASRTKVYKPSSGLLKFLESL